MYRWSDGVTDPPGCSAVEDSWLQETFTDGDRGLVAGTNYTGGLAREPTDTTRYFICKKGSYTVRVCVCVR